MRAGSGLLGNRVSKGGVHALMGIMYGGPQLSLQKN